jgi:hypothetical protein
VAFAGSATELIVNGGFETVPFAPWTTTNATRGWWNFDSAAGAHSGNRYEYIGKESDGTTTANNVEDLLYQDIAVPAGATSATLTFWLRITSNDTSGTAHDTLAIEVRNTSNTVLQNLATFSNTDAPSTGTWTQKTFTLSGYANQTIRITLHGKTDASIETVFRLDDVSVSASASCTYSLSPTSTSPTACANSGTFTVTAPAGCAWTASPNQNWIHTTSSGTGNGSASYTYEENNSTTPRSGTIAVQGQSFTINQAGLLAAPSLSTPADGATGVSTTPTFSWTPPTGANRSWITLSTSPPDLPTDPCASSCPNCVKVGLSGNTDQSSYTPSTAFPYGGTTRTLSPNTTYYWQVQGYNTSGAQGKYSTVRSFTTAPDLLPAPVLTGPANGATGVSTTPTFSWTPPAGANRSWITLSTSASDLPTDPAANSCPTCVSVGLSGNTDETTYTPPTAFPYGGTTRTLSPNTTYYWEVQGYNTGGAQGNYSTVRSFTTAPALLPAPVLTGPADSATGVSITPTLTWTQPAGADRFWITMSTSASDLPTDPYASTCPNCVSVGVSGNTDETTYTPPDSFPYHGTTRTLSPGTKYYWQVQGYSTGGAQGNYSAIRSFTTASGCSYSLNPTGATRDSNPGPGSFSVTTGAGCPWAALPNQSWIHASSSGSGSGTVSYTIDANSGTSQRTGSISVQGQAFTINQAAASGTVEIANVPYIHQIYDTPDDFPSDNGNGPASSACGPTTTLMAIQRYAKLAAHPVTCSFPNSHSSPYGWYVSDIYTYNGYTYNIPSSSTWTTELQGYDGLFGYFLQDNPGSSLQRSTRLKEILEQHGISSATDDSVAGETGFQKAKTEIDQGYPVIMLTTLTTAGHYVLCIGYIPGAHTLIFNDPYGNKNGVPYKAYNGARVFYDWPGYNNGYANLGPVVRFVYARATIGAGAGTPAPAPTITSFNRTGDAVIVKATTQAAYNYILEQKTLATDPIWNPIQTNNGTGAILGFSHPTATGPSGLYRIRAD